MGVGLLSSVGLNGFEFAPKGLLKPLVDISGKRAGGYGLDADAGVVPAGYRYWDRGLGERLLGALTE